MRWKLVTSTLLLFAASLGQAQFLPPYIADFQAQVTVHPDSTLTVVETIVVDFGASQWRGIFRKVPYRYRRTVKGFPLRYNLRLRLVSVTDGAGRPLPVKVWREGGYVFWRIGDPNRRVSGVQIYRITYAVARAINAFDTHDELYWNATGNEWEWGIAKASCVVVLPQSLRSDQIRYTFYTGSYGSKMRQGQARQEGNRVAFVAGPLRPGEGLTVVVGIPKGVLQLPSPFRQAIWWFQDNWSIPVGVLLPLLTFGLLFTRYWRYGRDPIWREALVVQYRPPEGITPGEGGVLLDERADNIDIVATIIDLAVKGYLKIREVPSTKWLFFRDTDYEFVFLRSEPPTKDHEQVVWSGLRLGGLITDSSVRLSELRERFYPFLQQAKTALYRSLTKQGFFAGNPETKRQVYSATGLILLVISPFAGIWGLSMHGGAGLALFAGFALSGLLCFIFAPAMPRKTQKGVKTLWHLLGFREFIRRVERDRLERMLQEDPLLFDRVLPYALVFGVADEWAQKFDGLLRQPPEWYESPSWTPTTFNTRVFVSHMGNCVTTVNSVLPAVPRSESRGAGGRISGFGGGGFSGGGFGGGGGGGW